MRKITLLALAAAPVLVGCAPAQVDMSFEADGVELAELGDANSTPEVFYELGGWRVDTECNETIEPTGDQIGEVTSGTDMVNQFGESVDLHDFCGRAVLIVSGSFT